MKISSLALAAVILLHGHSQSALAFGPSALTRQAVISKGRDGWTRPITTTSASVITSTTTSTSLFTATSPSSTTIAADIEKVQAELQLEYPPIVPFGKNAAPAPGGKRILGGKGANLAEMSELGLSVPPGFTITTECCSKFCHEWNSELPVTLWKQVVASLAAVEEEMDSQFGSPENPLLLSVRSGAEISMPGMLDTVLNLGMNDQVVEGLAQKTGNARFAWDSYR
jgi:Pyruvate phosphate dikinase, AMP/ATP-binding domain